MFYALKKIFGQFFKEFIKSNIIILDLVNIYNVYIYLRFKNLLNFYG